MDVYRQSECEASCRRCDPVQQVKDVKLAHAYVPFQRFCGVMAPLMSLCRGTAFPELYSPYSKREYVNLEPEKCQRPYTDRRVCYE
ncbi:MAG: spore coat associated protein CotJA [Clostridiales bacterium]|jgi:hypothetical protein|nr:spore coat associated protein CotJA [Clostridiales bacterium]